ncbi:unnamed protein product [Notodromas monacha]|uniref:Sushi domain-containing protein n=1 Tax=Notodromas monacha TaxID=399045 RepID=A0A7R9BDZ7_9CRUS|nr:unnamed protein product [Notodromas monacha]CAG0913052.1 unnamed protein product [Notodromas monacha]
MAAGNSVGSLMGTISQKGYMKPHVQLLEVCMMVSSYFDEMNDGRKVKAFRIDLPTESENTAGRILRCNTCISSQMEAEKAFEETLRTVLIFTDGLGREVKRAIRKSSNSQWVTTSTFDPANSQSILSNKQLDVTVHPEFTEYKHHKVVKITGHKGENVVTNIHILLLHFLVPKSEELQENWFANVKLKVGDINEVFRIAKNSLDCLSGSSDKIEYESEDYFDGLKTEAEEGLTDGSQEAITRGIGGVDCRKKPEPKAPKPKPCPPCPKPIPPPPPPEPDCPMSCKDKALLDSLACPKPPTCEEIVKVDRKNKVAALRAAWGEKVLELNVKHLFLSMPSFKPLGAVHGQLAQAKLAAMAIRYTYQMEVEWMKQLILIGVITLVNATPVREQIGSLQKDLVPTCTRPPSLENAFLSLPNVGKGSEQDLSSRLFGVGETAFYHCLPGYFAGKESRVRLKAKCEEAKDGTPYWNVKGSCSRNVRCNEPPVLPNADIAVRFALKQEFNPGEKIEYQCKDGYVSTIGSTSPYTKCKTVGNRVEWLPFVGFCSKLDCLRDGKCESEKKPTVTRAMGKLKIAKKFHNPFHQFGMVEAHKQHQPESPIAFSASVPDSETRHPDSTEDVFRSSPSIFNSDIDVICLDKSCKKKKIKEVDNEKKIVHIPPKPFSEKPVTQRWESAPPPGLNQEALCTGADCPKKGNVEEQEVPTVSKPYPAEPLSPQWSPQVKVTMEGEPQGMFNAEFEEFQASEGLAETEEKEASWIDCLMSFKVYLKYFALVFLVGAIIYSILHCWLCSAAKKPKPTAHILLAILSIIILYKLHYFIIYWPEMRFKMNQSVVKPSCLQSRTQHFDWENILDWQSVQKYVGHNVVAMEQIIHPGLDTWEVKEHVVPININQQMVSGFGRDLSCRQPVENSTKLHILIIVMSAAKNFAHRDRIRQTWGKVAKQNSEVFTVAFLVAVPRSRDQQALLIEEQNTNGDLVQSPVEELKFNIAFKDLMSILWMIKRCQIATHVLKTDDDLYVNIRSLFKFAKEHEKEIAMFGYRKTLKCFYTSAENYDMRNSSKLPGDYKTELSYPFPQLPTYLVQSYFYPAKLLPKLAEAAYKVPAWAMQSDRYITGILAEFAGIKRVDHPKFRVSFIESILSRSLLPKYWMKKKYKDAIIVSHVLAPKCHLSGNEVEDPSQDEQLPFEAQGED